MVDVVYRSECCLCDSNKLEKGLSLTPTPPANEFTKSICNQEVYPLDLYRCLECGHIQLGAIVNPEVLFRNYVYVSGTSPVFVSHFDKYCSDIIKQFDLKYDDLIVEIGSNDGTLLNCFAKRGFEKLVGFEPAVDIAVKAQKNGSFVTIPEFFDDQSIRLNRHHFSSSNGKAKIVLANNVFAHSDELWNITNNISSLLDEDGVFIFEVSYFVDVLQKCLFDTIYHEHISYHTVHPLKRFFEQFGLNLFHVDRINTHGGSIRCFVDKKLRSDTNSIVELNELECSLGLVPTINAFKSNDPLTRLKWKIDLHKFVFRTKLDELKNTCKVIGGYGAPAKATTLMYEFGLDSNDIQFIVDDSPWKQGLFTPGKHIPVISSEEMKLKNPDCLVILAWNFAESIIEKNKEFVDNGGKFLTPIDGNNGK